MTSNNTLHQKARKYAEKPLSGVDLAIIDKLEPSEVAKMYPQVCAAFNGYLQGFAEAKRLADVLAAAIKEYDEANLVAFDGQEKTPEWRGRWDAAREGLSVALFKWNKTTGGESE